MMTLSIFVMFSGHLMMTMNPRTFKSLERLGIKWKNWSYQTYRHKPPYLELLGVSFLETIRSQVKKDLLEYMYPKTHG